MMMTKDGVERDVGPDQLNKYTLAGWIPVTDEQVGEEIIRLKPVAVKNKATVRALDEANDYNKGDE
jgi:hypothetical protein